MVLCNGSPRKYKSSLCSCSVAQSCLTLCNPMDSSPDTFAERMMMNGKWLGFLFFLLFFYQHEMGFWKNIVIRSKGERIARGSWFSLPWKADTTPSKKQGVRLNGMVLIAFLLLIVGLPSGPVVKKNLRAMQEMGVQSQGLKDPQEKEMATHSSTLAWKTSWTEEPGRL